MNVDDQNQIELALAKAEECEQRVLRAKARGDPLDAMDWERMRDAWLRRIDCIIAGDQP